MDYREWVASQFELRRLESGRVCFRTPCIDYTLSEEDFEFLKGLFLEFED